MRAAGLPARVVSGYRSGQWVQPWGGTPYLEIRQGNAHAWSEVWLPDQGWVDVDPSQWASTESSDDPSNWERSDLRWWRWVQRQWWGLDMAWSRWWLGFDRGSQRNLVESLVGTNQHALSATAFAAVGATLATGIRLASIQGTRRNRMLTRSQKVLNTMKAELRRLGLKTSPGEDLEAYCRRAYTTYPELRDALIGLANTYQEIRFSDKGQDRRSKEEAEKKMLLYLRQVRYSSRGIQRCEQSLTEEEHN